MLIGINIEKCNDCPFIEHNLAYREIYDVYKHRYFCEKANRILAVYNNENPFIKIPEWCPCRIEEEVK